MICVPNFYAKLIEKEEYSNSARGKEIQYKPNKLNNHTQTSSKSDYATHQCCSKDASQPEKEINISGQAGCNYQSIYTTARGKEKQTDAKML